MIKEQGKTNTATSPVLGNPRKTYNPKYKVKPGQTIDNWIQGESQMSGLPPEETINALLLKAFEQRVTLVPQVS